MEDAGRLNIGNPIIVVLREKSSSVEWSNMHRYIMEDIEQLNIGDPIIVSLAEKSNKFSMMKHQLGDDLELHRTSCFDNISISSLLL